MSYKLIYGIAYNSKGKYLANSGTGSTVAYQAWFNMLTRCYCPKKHLIQPTYVGCSVAEDWLDFQDFAEWYHSHPYSELGYELDKDLLSPNNKVYSPSTCVFVPQELNKILCGRKSLRGKLPQGVTFNKRSARFKVQLSANSCRVHLGYFDCVNEAYQAYKTAKERHVKNKALEWANRIDWNVFQALMKWELNPE